MNTQDDQLKQMILAELTPALAHDFEDRVLARILAPMPQKSWLKSHAWAGLSRHVDRSNSRRLMWLGGLLLALTLVAWGTHHVVQWHGDDELNRLDAVGMSSLLTL